jgi:hypothetical protein
MGVIGSRGRGGNGAINFLACMGILKEVTKKNKKYCDL